MNIAKLGRYLVYAIFYACTWVIHFIIAVLIGAPFMDDDASGFVNALIFLVVFVLPILASIWATKAFAKRWAKVRDEKEQKKAALSSPPEEYTEPTIVPAPIKSSAKAVKKIHVNVKTKSSETKSPYSQDEYFRYGGADAELLSIDLMEGHQFEYWCAEMLRNLGFVDVEVTPASGDHGVDVLAKKEGVKYAIQCKRYRTDLGNTPVQEVHAGKAMYHCHVGIVITNQHFTEGARVLAQATDVLLWDRDFLKAYLLRYSPAPLRSKETAAERKPVDLVDNSNADLEHLYLEAVKIVLDTKQASVSMLQRRMRIGYAQAARLIDMMEDRKVVGPFNGSTPRKILIHTHK